MSLSKCGLTCSTTQIGPVSYRGSGMTFIILREQVCNLRWYSTARIDEKSSCSVGTVFIIPASTDLLIYWPERTEVVIGQFDQQLLQGALFESSLLEEINDFRSATKFSCKESLPICHMIWEEICQRSGQGGPYLDALGLVLSHTIARSLLNDRALIDSKGGLSAIDCHQIETYLNQNFHKPLSVPDMAEMLGISAGHFSTCFRISFGQTPHQYLMGLRLDEAERCLRKTSMTISEIARHLNFSSQSHLTTALRKYRHATPGELRR
ncbi:DNA-binding protein [Ochrobactrum vermis]|nr:DNA-binding protein [Ochrobactrum vermis]